MANDSTDDLIPIPLFSSKPGMNKRQTDEQCIAPYQVFRGL